MATLANLAQEIADVFRSGLHISVTKVIRSSAASDSIELPEGLKSNAHVVSVPEDSASGALTIGALTKSDHPAGGAIAVSGGTTGAVYYIIGLHIGNAAGL
jgi:hypothetical protein